MDAIEAILTRLPDGRWRVLRGQRLGGGHVRAECDECA